MNVILPEIKSTQSWISPSPPSLIPLKSNTSFDLTRKISPDTLVIIIILSIIFLICGLIHILVKFLLTPSTQNREAYVTALQGQLQQLFNLHDSGVDQSLIDTLPIFHYKSIIGLKISSFDCSVCLCEFETEDKLRLLPKCSHAFHVDCIDTWLLSHSTCPLCRSYLLPSDFSSPHNPSSREDMVHVSDPDDFGSVRKSCDQESDGLDEKVVPLEVKLGKFRNIDHVGEGSNNNNNNISDYRNVDKRRCLSMGSYDYIMDQEATLKVHVSTKKLSGHGTVVGTEKRVLERESFSLSKIWLRGKKEKQKGSSSSSSSSSSSCRCARDQDCSLMSSSTIGLPNEQSISIDEEKQKSENSESLETKTPSFAKRSIVWLAGRQNKVVHPSSTSHV